MTPEWSIPHAAHICPVSEGLPSLGVTDEPLSDRELDVLRYLPTILTTGEIGAELHMSINAVKCMKSIYRKLGASRRREAVTHALRTGVEGLANNGASPTEVDASESINIAAHLTIDSLSATTLSDEWIIITAYAESIEGGGFKGQIGEAVVKISGGTAYGVQITVPAHTFPENPAPPASGVYKIYVVLTHRNLGKTSNIFAVVEGPILRIQ
jgi:DNA-binding CsgD family transcriptional regulator